MQFVNDAEEESLDDAVIEGDIVSGNKYVSKFPARIVKLLKAIREDTISSDALLKEIESIHAETSDYTFCAIVGDTVIYSNDDDEDNVIATAEIGTLFKDDIESVEGSVDDCISTDYLLAYDFRTGGKIIGVDCGVCCIAPPTISDLGKLEFKAFKDKLLEYASMIED